MKRVTLKSTLLAGVFFALTAPAGFAADLPVEVEPAFVPVYDWNGFYVGSSIGYGWSDFDGKVEDTRRVVVTPDDNDDDKDHHKGHHDEDDTVVETVVESIETWRPFDESSDGDGFVAGTHVGYNFSMWGLVFGAEADLSWADIKSDSDLEDDLGVFGEAEFNIDWLGTVRGRVGWGIDRFLIYATGGAAFASVEAEVDYGGQTFDADDTLFGWTVGAGVEGFITPNLTAKIEYLYVSLDGDEFDLDDFDDVDVNAQGDLDLHIVRAGLNYKFNW